MLFVMQTLPISLMKWLNYTHIQKSMFCQNGKGLQLMWNVCYLQLFQLCYWMLMCNFYDIVAPDAINNYVKTYKHQRRNMHFIAPEYGKTHLTLNNNSTSIFFCFHSHLKRSLNFKSCWNDTLLIPPFWFIPLTNCSVPIYLPTPLYFENKGDKFFTMHQLLRRRLS